MQILNLAENLNMKIFKRIALSVVIFITLLLSGGYFYFDKKFTPPKNNLTVFDIAQNVAICWDSTDENTYAAVLLPVRLKGIDRTFYMQLDSGSPTTLFYKESLEAIREKFQYPIQCNAGQNRISLQFTTGNMKIASDDFELRSYGNAADLDYTKKNPIIGTIGTDLFEKRIAVLDFKNGTFSFLESMDEKEFETFEFKKRKILIPAVIEGQKLKLLYDSGTSGYELITNNEEWQKYRREGGSIKKEKGNSWGNILTVISAPADKMIGIGNRALKLSEVTHIEGTSKMQNFLMKTSGMQGMIGNKLFLNHTLILDCKNRKFKLK